MLSLYEILKASKTGIATDMWTALAGMNWGGKDSGAEVKELTGIPPLSFTADGTPLLDYLISGNLSQTGTPTPTTPIQPSECGDLETEGTHAGQYKIPILSANTTTPVYLGEVETTRQIKKLVLTGDESWSYAISNAPFKLNLTEKIKAPLPTIVFWVCSHYEAVSNSASWVLYDSCISWSNNDEGSGLRFRDIRYSNLDDFKAYIAQQYANGTPVTVWYVLATEETGIVNEPLMRIGDYADTLSMEQAGVSIPTNNGSTTVDVETTLKPSQMYIKYKG